METETILSPKELGLPERNEQDVKEPNLPGTKSVFVAEDSDSQPTKSDGDNSTEASRLPGTKVVLLEIIPADERPEPTKGNKQNGEAGPDAAQNLPGTRVIYRGDGRFTNNLSQMVAAGSTRSARMLQARSARAAVGSGPLPARGRGKPAR